MPRDRSSGRKSSSENKSDIDQTEDKGQQEIQVQQNIENTRKKSQVENEPIQNQQLESKQSQKEKQEVPQKNQPEIQAPNRYTVFRESFNFNWNMKDFNIEKAVQQFGKLDRYSQLEDSEDQTEESSSTQKQKQKKQSKELKIKIKSSNRQTTGLNKKTSYLIKGNDKNSEFQISRTYKEFVLLRQKLVLRWPGCFIAPIPTKTFGNNPYELVLIRIRFLNNFLKKLVKVPEIYYSQECQIFFNRTTEEYIHSNGKIIESQLEKLKTNTNVELLQKYKEAFGNIVEDLTEEQQSIAITEIKELEEKLKSWKVDLTRYKDQIRSLITVKDKYYQAMTRLSITLLPEYEDIVLGWINGNGLNKKQIVQQKSQTQKQGYLLNTQEYGAALKDTASSVRNYNQSLWLIYDIFKFQLRETDAILEAIQSYQFLVREKQYLTRNIAINKQQIGSVDQKKTTLKIFMMSGSAEQKKQRLNKQSESFQEKLKVVKQLLNFVLNVLINSIDNFHADRAQEYKKKMAKSGQQELVLVKKLMDFHMFQLQVFKRKDIFGKNQSQKTRQEQIVEE